MNIKAIGNDLIIENIKNFDIGQTLDCGQSFRWKSLEDGCFGGIAFGKHLKLRQNGEKIIFFNTNYDDFNNIWRVYFDLDTDYQAIIHSIKTPLLKTASQFGFGIHILRQDSWEALCSFIISQNNNIPRIKGIIERLCENFGEPIDGGFAFPTPEKIAALTFDDLSVLRSGFRAKYILDAAQKIASNQIDLLKISKMDIDSARTELMKIYGVGKKVADCTMLYGMAKTESFPVDVWIKRAIKTLFNGDLPEANGKYAGIFQQYVFYYALKTKLKIN